MLVDFYCQQQQQNIEISNALDNVLETISDPLAIERGAKGFQQAAQKAIDNAVAQDAPVYNNLPEIK